MVSACISESHNVCKSLTPNVNSSTYYYRPALVNNIWGNFTIATYYNLASTDEFFDGCIVYWCSLRTFKEHWLHHRYIGTLGLYIRIAECIIYKSNRVLIYPNTDWIIGTLVIYPLRDESLMFVAFIIWLLLLTLLSHKVYMLPRSSSTYITCSTGVYV